nr:arginase [uncultured bacterium]AIA14934.1 arginase [uncultured bacterium]AIA15594.1 arginase [uncultured bacterium]
MFDRDFPGKGKTLGILGVPLGFAASTVGSELGPQAIRQQKLKERIETLGYAVKDYGDLNLRNPERRAEKGENPRFLREMIAASDLICSSVSRLFKETDIPLVLGGDHSIAMATLSGVSSHFHSRNEEIGLIWFDAHGDINTPDTSLSGNLHGMPLAVLFGKGAPELTNLCGFAPKLNPKFCAHVGTRDLDLGEKRIIRELGLRCFTMNEIDRRGMNACIEDALEIVSQASAGFSVTFDVDVLDPLDAPGSGTLVRGGISYREAHLALERVAETQKMRSFEIVEVNPTLDTNNRTSELAVELILSALGKTIL